MTRKTKVKFLFFIIGVMLLVPASMATVTLFAEFIAYFQQGADPASIFRGHSLILPDADAMQWIDLGDDVASQPTRAEQEEILAAYWAAWQGLVRAHLTDDTSDLATYWAGDAYQQAIMGFDEAFSRMMTHTGHRLSLIFFSDDGSVVAFSDVDLTLTQTIDDIVLTLQVSADVVMTLDQGNWRVRSITLYYD